MTSQLDAELLSLGVYFLPWIGQRYDSGSESDACSSSGNRTVPCTALHVHREKFTRHCVSEAIMRVDNGTPFWINIEAAHLNGLAVDASEFWDRVAFYNYVQSPVGNGPRHFRNRTSGPPHSLLPNGNRGPCGPNAFWCAASSSGSTWTKRTRPSTPSPGLPPFRRRHRMVLGGVSLEQRSV
jgi:hypothetical protein